MGGFLRRNRLNTFVSQSTHVDPLEQSLSRAQATPVQPRKSEWLAERWELSGRLGPPTVWAHVLKRGSGIGGQPGESRPRTEPLRTSCSYFRATHEFHSVWPCP